VSDIARAMTSDRSMVPFSRVSKHNLHVSLAVLGVFVGLFTFRWDDGTAVVRSQGMKRWSRLRQGFGAQGYARYHLGASIIDA
jgi:hypothetical protein